MLVSDPSCGNSTALQDSPICQSHTLYHHNGQTIHLTSKIFRIYDVDGDDDDNDDDDDDDDDDVDYDDDDDDGDVDDYEYDD